MSAAPVVSIIIPAFNAQDSIRETLDSVLAQTYRNLEIIVVDDGSTDATAEIVHRYEPHVRYYYQQNSGGCAVPRNNGISRSTGQFICFIDADDIMLPKRVARHVDFMEHHPEVGFTFCDYRNFDDQGPSPSSHFETCPRLWPLLNGRRNHVLERPCELLVRENFGIAGSLFVRRRVLDLAHGFEPTLRACEDFHLYYRLARRSPVAVINEVGMMRRLHGNNMSASALRMFSEGARSRALLRDSETDPRLRALLSGYIADCYASLARYHADRGDYLRAIGEDWRALQSDARANSAWRFCRGVARTVAMALDVHRPRLNAG